MNKFLLLLTTLVGFSAAGVLDIGVMRDRNLERLGGGTNKIQEMTKMDLQRQKFLLDVLQRVNGPPTNEQIVRLGQTLVTDPRLYIGGIDGDMELVIELAKQQNLISENEICTIRNENHVRQMRGMYQLLVRSGDWETLQRNIAFMRLNVNSVAFVNALVLALRDREDTQMLIVPGIEEILPEVYLDQEVVRKAQNININTLQNKIETQRPSLLDLIGLRKHTTGLNRLGLNNGILNKGQLWMPWRDMRLDLAQRKLNSVQERIVTKRQNQLVIPMERRQMDNDINLVTEDIGLKTFVQDIVNNLVLIEGDKLNMNDRLRYGQTGRSNGILDIDERQQLMQERNIDNERRNVIGHMQNRNINMGGVEELPTSDINNERLLHVNRRLGSNNLDQQETQFLGNERGRFENIIRGGRVSDGRRISQQMEDDDDILNLGWMHIPNMRRNNEGTTIRKDMRQKKTMNMNMNDNNELPTTSIDNERLLHVNRRRLNQQNENVESLIGHRFSSSIGDGRHVDSKKLINQEDRVSEHQRIINKMTGNDDDVNVRGTTGERITRNELIQLISELGLTVDDIIDLIPTINQNRGKSTGRINPLLLQRMQQENDINDRYLLHNTRRTMGDINELEDEDINLLRHRSPRSLRNTEMLGGDRLHEHKVQQVIEVILHNIQQLAARVNLDRISLGQQGQVNSRRVNNPNLLDSMDQRYALRLNEMRLDMSNNRVLLEKISNVERRLETVMNDVLGQIMDNTGSDIHKEHIVNRVIGNVVTGRLGNVGILDILRQLGGLVQQQMKVNKGNGLEIELADPVVQHLLNRIVRIVDKLRQEHLGSRQVHDLEMKGVTINNVLVDRLITFIDESDLDLVNLLNTDTDLTLNDEQRMQKMVVARQQRLNHKDFKIDMDITSDHNQRVVVRTLLGPKTDLNGRETSLDERRQNFVVLDTMTTNLQTGRNRITRKSRDLAYTVQDTTPFTEIYQQVMSAIRGDVSVIKQRKVIGHNGRFPHRLLLPRGQVQGLPMELLVIVTPIENVDDSMRTQHNLEHQITPIGVSTMNVDNEPLGFPLDRQIVNENQLLNLSNVKVCDVMIYHDN